MLVASGNGAHAAPVPKPGNPLSITVIRCGDEASARFTSLLFAATLHIHVMRNAPVGVIVTNRYADQLQVCGPRATALKMRTIGFFR